jgi:hypothetical protein
MRKIYLFMSLLFTTSISYGQDIIYYQTNKIMEYEYAIIDSLAMTKISEIERIKYGLKVVEKKFSKTIDANFNSNFSITVESNGYEQSWLELAKKFNYTNTGIEIFGKDNVLMKTIPYTDEQLQAENRKALEIQSDGYHPGIKSFPVFTQDMITMLASQNVIVNNINDDITQVKFQNKTYLYNKRNYTIIREWVGDDGFINKETSGYEPYQNNMGYLIKINKLEKYVYSVNGPCITEVFLKYYSEYDIDDIGKLINKATEIKESIAIYPNPNDGVFTVVVSLANENTIVNAKIVDVITGNIKEVSNNGNNTFLVDLPNLPKGQYTFQVTTNTSVLNSRFQKQ